MSGFVLSPRARADLDGIWNYSVETWSAAQAERYLRQIADAFEILSADPRRGQDCSEIRRGYRKFATGSHVIFFRMNGGVVDVIRILHSRMDFARQL